MKTESSLVPAAQAPCGLDHLVLNVRDIEESHRFWTEMLGFRHVGSAHSPLPGRAVMRFYSGMREGRLNHHDVALVEPVAPAASAPPPAQSLNHVAIEYPSREAWERQLAWLQSHGVEMRRNIERGATHGVEVFDPNGIQVELLYVLPRAQWEADIDGALNQAVERPV
jgi:catechol 2,3-dioxygenase